MLVYVIHIPFMAAPVTDDVVGLRTAQIPDTSQIKAMRLRLFGRLARQTLQRITNVFYNQSSSI